MYHAYSREISVRDAGIYFSAQTLFLTLLFIGIDGYSPVGSAGAAVLAVAVMLLNYSAPAKTGVVCFALFIALVWMSATVNNWIYTELVLAGTLFPSLIVLTVNFRRDFVELERIKSAVAFILLTLNWLVLSYETIKLMNEMNTQPEMFQLAVVFITIFVTVTVSALAACGIAVLRRLVVVEANLVQPYRNLIDAAELDSFEEFHQIDSVVHMHRAQFERAMQGYYENLPRLIEKADKVIETAESIISRLHGECPNPSNIEVEKVSGKLLGQLAEYQARLGGSAANALRVSNAHEKVADALEGYMLANLKSHRLYFRNNLIHISQFMVESECNAGEVTFWSELWTGLDELKVAAECLPQSEIKQQLVADIQETYDRLAANQYVQDSRKIVKNFEFEQMVQAKMR